MMQPEHVELFRQVTRWPEDVNRITALEETLEIYRREDRRLRLVLAEIMNDPDRAREIARGALK